MGNADNKLRNLGFLLTERNDECGYWLYNNENCDQHVEIDFDSEDWFVYSRAISTHEPMALTYNELKAFMEKIEELKNTLGDVKCLYNYETTKLKR